MRFYINGFKLNNFVIEYNGQDNDEINWAIIDKQWMDKIDEMQNFIKMCGAINDINSCEYGASKLDKVANNQCL